MILMMFTAVATFAVAAYLGLLIAEALYAGQEPFEDGPQRIVVPKWVFVAAGALVGIAMAFHGVSTAQLITSGIATIALVACAAVDLECGLVPDVFTLLPLGALVLWYAFHGDFGPALSAVVVAIPFAVVATFSRGRGMGWGDVKLAALGGALLGARGAVIALFLACVAVIIASRIIGRDKKQPVAFAPYLVSGIGVVLMIGASA